MPDPSSPTGVTTPRTVEPAVTIVVADEQSAVPIDADRWADLARSVLVAEGCAGELTLTFVDRAEISELNREHMGIDGPTDVLSFPLDADPHAQTVPGVPVLLGDVVICPEIAVAAAPEHAGTADDELALLVVHGVLHVLGHDHHEPDETTRMRAAELDHLIRRHWHGPAPRGFRQAQELRA
jgi:probable rRNA maturation factor